MDADSFAIGQLSTEQRNARTAALDAVPVNELVRMLHEENHRVAGAIDPALPQIAKAVEVIAERLGRGGRLFYAGAGTSGRLGVLDASECPPTFGVEPEMVQGIIAGGERAIRNPVEGAEDDPAAGIGDIQARAIGADDVVVGIAASGRTPYVIGALQAARERGAFTVAVANSDPAAIAGYADIAIIAVTGPEPLTGSTRLKAGTAQKMILNLLSTGAMVRMGKTYGNLMVDVRATNAKLRDRALRIVMTATTADRSAALDALERASWSAKYAIVALRLGISTEEAAARLRAAGGFVRAALGESAQEGPE